jgi:hypothetical protein
LLASEQESDANRSRFLVIALHKQLSSKLLEVPELARAALVFRGTKDETGAYSNQKENKRRKETVFVAFLVATVQDVIRRYAATSAIKESL